MPYEHEKLNILETIDATQIGNIINDYKDLLDKYESIKLEVTGLAPGDKVRICQDLNIPSNSGWAAFKHVLVIGKEAEVMEVTYNLTQRVFMAAILVKDITYLSTITNNYEPDSDKIFYLPTIFLAKV